MAAAISSEAGAFLYAFVKLLNGLCNMLNALGLFRAKGIYFLNKP